MIFLSIIVPAYNEEERLGASLEKIHSYLNTKGFKYEVIVVDDGSTDKTDLEAQQSQLFKEGKLSLIRNEINMGKGFSVKRGILASKGDYVLFSDADLSTPIEELEKLFVYIREGYDIIIGSRAMDDSDVRVHQPWQREGMGKTFNFFIRMFLMKDFNDTQCGFKLFKGEIVRKLAAALKITGFCFDVELLYLAKVKGHRIKEIGIIWKNSSQSKVKVIGSSVNMLLDLLMVKRLHK